MLAVAGRPRGIRTGLAHGPVASAMLRPSLLAEDALQQLTGGALPTWIGISRNAAIWVLIARGGYRHKAYGRTVIQASVPPEAFCGASRADYA